MKRYIKLHFKYTDLQLFKVRRKNFHRKLVYWIINNLITIDSNDILLRLVLLISKVQKFEDNRWIERISNYSIIDANTADL